MNIREVYDAKSVAIQHETNPSNLMEYLGEGLFPAQKKLGLDLKWIKTSKGLPVSLSPSNFDAKSVLRGREGFKIDNTEMAFFRESMLIKEQDEQDMMRIQDAGEPYAAEILSHIYDDAETLIQGAAVVPERMRMQLLAPTVDGSPRITISANGAQYSYNYDPDEDYKTNHYTALTEGAMWSASTTCDPIADLDKYCDAVEEICGSRPAIAIMSKKTMGYLKKSDKVKTYVLAQNVSANVIITDERVKEVFRSELGLEIVVYTKKFKDESGNAQAFYPDDFVTLIPAGELGSTWYGTTPEERTLMGNAEADVAIVNTGVAVAVTTTNDPVNTKTTVSEIVLPSYERMNETFVIKVNTAG